MNSNSHLSLATAPTDLSPWSWSALLIALALSSTVFAAEIFVSPVGRDSNPGTPAAPVGTLARARDLARPLAGHETVNVKVADGIYYLPETLVFSPADSGTAAHPIVYQAEHEGGAVISGGSRLELSWRPYRDGIFQAATPVGLAIDQLFINGQRQRMARYPNYDASQPTAAYQGYSAEAFSRERAAGWADPVGGYIHAMHGARWGGYHYRITGKDADGEITYAGGWQNNRRAEMHKEFRMVENIFEELDAAGEWFHDAKSNTLYYQPESDADLSQAVVEVVRLRHLIEFDGSIETPVRFITLQGFVVRHAARTFMETREPLLRSDWAIYRGGAVLLTGTEDVRILDTEFDQVGGNAIFVSNYNHRTLVKGCHIHDAGASGVCFVGDPEAVRNPLFEYREKNHLDTIDRTPGPLTNNYPADGAVEDSLIHGIGLVERQPAGVQISMSQGITVRDTSIYDCARAGINISEGTWGGHLIERCDVFDTVLETHDHGSFNSWGRDRFWRSDRAVTQAAVDVDPTLPFLDAMQTTVIRDSRWRCDHGWDIDLDDGSSNYDIYNNLMLNGGLKFREGFRRRAWNNITVNNGFHPHVWFLNSEDEVHTNIFMRAHAEIGVVGAGREVDRNLFYSNNPKSKDAYPQFNWDRHSVAADPQFVDPAKGDFRVKAGSPALALGFQNFPMDQFGVKKPQLKAIARTPVIPAVDLTDPVRKPRKTNLPTVWLGAKLHVLEGKEFSAFGVAKEAGGVVLSEVPAGSAAALAGFQSRDLIQGINGQKISEIQALFKALAQAGGGALAVELVRDQQPITLTVAARKRPAATAPTPTSVIEPTVLGHGRGVFTIGPVLHTPSLDDPAAWHLQIQQTAAATHERVVFGNNLLDLYMPDRGSTAWFKQELEGPITIVYRVRCPVETLTDPGIQARDINNFWHASDPVAADGLFDDTRYTGTFTSYNKMLGYYASTGGGGATGNQTTRMRRYPREINGEPVPHIALNDRDGQSAYLITPGKWHTVQLVAYEGIAQYIVDGVLVYEIYPGQDVAVEVPQGNDAGMVNTSYGLDKFPAYTSGYFGLRLVGTHHQYADVRIHRLLPVGAAAR